MVVSRAALRLEGLIEKYTTVICMRLTLEVEFNHRFVKGVVDGFLPFSPFTSSLPLIRFLVEWCVMTGVRMIKWPSSSSPPKFKMTRSHVCSDNFCTALLTKCSIANHPQISHVPHPITII